MIKVNEIFPTIQGEGHWSGTPATFIRLQGCPVGCPWCDTKHTWKAPPQKQVDVNTMLAKQGSSPRWAEMEESDIVDAVQGGPLHFVITGGEPCLQDIYQLTVLLGRQGRVQIETSGCYPVNVAADTWVTVSPKIDMPGGLQIDQQAINRANEIKMPVECQHDVDVLDGLLAKLWAGDKVIALQPVSQGKDATTLCITTCMARNWKLSLQTHKFEGIR